MRHRVALPDLAIAAGGILLVAGFLPWYGLQHGVVTVDGGRGGPSVTAWQASPAWWVPVPAGVAVAGLWLLRRGGRIPATLLRRDP